MLIQLPLEVWMDILGWLRKYRREVAIKINQIGDYQFTEIVQHWLHDYTKNLLLGQMFTTRNEDGKARLEICTGDEGPDNDQGHISVPFAQVPIPDNISDVKRIIIKFLDSNVLDFLRKLGEFFTQFVIVGQKKRLENARTAIAHLLPIFDGIDTFMFDDDSAPLLFFIRDHFPSKFYAASFIKVIRVHCLQFTDDYANALLNWLSHERNHGQPPRMLLLKTCSTSASKFVEDIKKRFLAATTPTAYMVQIIAADLSTIQTSTIENVTTGERLIFQMSVELFIIRCSATASDDGFGEWIEHTRHKKQGECWLQTAKLGMIDEDLDMEEAVGQFFKLVADE